jgi:hypothetical protein
LAYYYLGQALLKTGSISENIDSLDNEVSQEQGQPDKSVSNLRTYIYGLEVPVAANEQLQDLERDRSWFWPQY